MEMSLPHLDEEITVAGFERWLRTARQGERFIYHRGFLAADREKITVLPNIGSYVHVYYEPFDSLGKTAWHAYEHGVVELVQNKLPGAQGYEYIAFKRATAKRR